MITTYQRGWMEGWIEGWVQGRIESRAEIMREIAVLQLGANFCPISPKVKHLVEALPADQIRQFLVDLVKADSLEEPCFPVP
jgi:hypothetical protein